MRIQVRRTGGFAGIERSPRWTPRGGPTPREWHALAERALGRRPGHARRAGVPDGFSYRITVGRADRPLRRPAADRGPARADLAGPQGRRVRPRRGARGSARPRRPSAAGARSEPQLAQLLRVPLPVLGDLHMQVQEDRRAEQRLDVLAGLRADLLQPLALRADDDALLAGALDVDVGVDVQQRLVRRAVLARAASPRPPPRSSAAARPVRLPARPRGSAPRP